MILLYDDDDRRCDRGAQLEHHVRQHPQQRSHFHCQVEQSPTHISAIYFFLGGKGGHVVNIRRNCEISHFSEVQICQ